MELAKGTIQQYNNVRVNEGPLPPWAQKKAADHIRERTEAALKLRERDCLPPPAGPGVIGGTSINPPLGTALIGNITLPPFAEKRDPVPDSLPDPKPIDPKNPPKVNPPSLPSGIGMNALPTAPSRLAPPPMSFPTAPVAGGAEGSGEYFQPVGTASLPPLPQIGRSPSLGKATPIPSAPPTPLPPLSSEPAPSVPSAPPLPVPLSSGK
jgi:hypothetical protein